MWWPIAFVLNPETLLQHAVLPVRSIPPNSLNMAPDPEPTGPSSRLRPRALNLKIQSPDHMSSKIEDQDPLSSARHRRKPGGPATKTAETIVLVAERICFDNRVCKFVMPFE